MLRILFLSLNVALLQGISVAQVDQERFHVLLFSIKDSIFPIHMIGKFCYKQEKRLCF
jgi:hypothetical protein